MTKKQITSMDDITFYQKHFFRDNINKYIKTLKKTDFFKQVNKENPILKGQFLLCSFRSLSSFSYNVVYQDNTYTGSDNLNMAYISHMKYLEKEFNSDIDYRFMQVILSSVYFARNICENARYIDYDNHMEHYRLEAHRKIKNVLSDSEESLTILYKAFDTFADTLVYKCPVTGKKIDKRAFVHKSAMPKGMIYCPHCGRIEKESPLDDICERCLRNQVRRKSYDTRFNDISILKPFDRLKSESDTQFFGIELEVDVHDEEEFFNQQRKSKFGCTNLFYKSDSSLGDEGLEIVSVPSSYSKQMKYWKDLFDNNKEFSVDEDDIEGYGLHMHISRTGFAGIDHLIRFITFFNCDENTDAIEKIAGRTIENGSAEWCRKNDYSREDVIKKNGHMGERYSVTNLQNSATVEVRCMGSTDDWETFEKRTKFIYDVFRFTKYSRKAMTVKAMQEWSTKGTR